MSWLMIGLLYALCFWVGWKLPAWRWSACTCGRARIPYFAARHEKEWITWALAGLYVVMAVGLALGGGGWMMFIMGLLTVWMAKCAWEHHKGRVKKPKKAAGLVKINEHGRLVVE